MKYLTLNFPLYPVLQKENEIHIALVAGFIGQDNGHKWHLSILFIGQSAILKIEQVGGGRAGPQGRQQLPVLPHHPDGDGGEEEEGDGDDRQHLGGDDDGGVLIGGRRRPRVSVNYFVLVSWRWKPSLIS